MDGSEIWAHINDSVSAGAWPLVVLVCAIIIVFAFREQVGDRIRSIREANVAGASLKMDASAEANEVLGETVPEILARPEPKPITAVPDKPADANGEPKIVTGGAHLEGRASMTAEADVARAEGTVSEADAAEADHLFARREQIEEIIRASWRAGVEAGQTGTFAEPPEPNVVWTGSKPEIKGWNIVVRRQPIRTGMQVGRIVGEVKLGAQQPGSEQVRRLEAEIRRLRESGAAMPRKAATPDYLLYLELLEKLRRLDPKSPFA